MVAPERYPSSCFCAFHVSYLGSWYKIPDVQGEYTCFFILASCFVVDFYRLYFCALHINLNFFIYCEARFAIDKCMKHALHKQMNETHFV